LKTTAWVWSCGAAYANHLAHSIGRETDSIAFYNSVELSRREHFRPFQATPILQLFLPLHILHDGKWKHDEEDPRASEGRPLVTMQQAGSFK
jgi:hypothetical protein